MYASTYFRNYDFDALTVSAYMGSDSVRPFLEYAGKWTILLALTSNEGAGDFQFLKIAGNPDYLFQKIIEVSKSWGNEDNMMYVVGATKAAWMKQIRKIIPGHFILVPGIGAQGGSLEEVSDAGLNAECGLLVNVSRSVIYADATNKFDDGARAAAEEIRKQMTVCLKNAGLL
jgi:orotidine-5'-phosphate decarboxylase